MIVLGTAVFYYHNSFQRHYQKYRQNVEVDRSYIIQKRKMGSKESHFLSIERKRCFANKIVKRTLVLLTLGKYTV